MVVSWDELPLSDLLDSAGLVKRKRGVKRKNKRDFFNIVTAFDIETTTIYLKNENGEDKPHSFMYVWQWQFGEDYTVIGRTWEEFSNLCKRISNECYNRKSSNAEQRPLLVGYIHNLAFEFQYLRGVYAFQTEDCFFREPRKPLYCRLYNSIEFRCSYLQSNMSLAKFAEKMGCKSFKRSGEEFDYSKIRYPWTPLTEKELEYCINDVVCLEEALRLEMQKDGDTLETIPLTSTGYVRRDCKRACYPIRQSIQAMLPNEEQYRLLRQAFRGGNTHANRAYVGKVLENVESVDMTSCYPAQQLIKDFPMTPYRWVDPPTLERCLKFIKIGNSVVMELELIGLELRDNAEPIPYISLSKTKSYGFRADNGRILDADYCKLTLTEIDLGIVLKQYRWKAAVCLKAMTCRKAPLPDVYKKVIQHYYNLKTELKGNSEREYEYMKSKNKLNSVYGMSAQDPVHQRVEYNNGEYITSDYNSADVAETLAKANFPYQWGVYTTAYARDALQAGIDLAGANIVYCDTDSVKTAGSVDFSALNAERTKAAKKTKAYANDNKGVTHYVGVYEVDGHYKRFITQGAKRYAYEIDKNGKIKMGVTVSGVTKKINPETGIPYAVEELQTLERFQMGMRWEAAGGTMAVYNDTDDLFYTDKDTGRKVHIGINVAIVPTTYEMTRPADYEALLKNLILWKEFLKKHE